MKQIIIFVIVGIVGSIFYFRRRYELASLLQWRFFLGTVFVVPVFGSLSSFALSQTILPAFLRGDFFAEETQSLWDAWFFTTPMSMIFLNLYLYFFCFRKVTTENIHLIPAKVVKYSLIIIGFFFTVGVYRIFDQGLLRDAIAIATPAHLLTLTYFIVLMGYVSVEKVVRNFTELNYGSLTKRMLLNTVLPLGFSILYMIDAAYLISIFDASTVVSPIGETQLVVIRLFCAFIMLMSVFSYALYETFKLLIVPVNQLSRALSGISSGEGDLTKRLYVESRDDLGDLSVYFNRFLRQIFNIVTSIAEVSGMIKHAITELVQSSSRMVNATQDIVKSLDKENESIERVNEQVTRLDTASTEIAKNAQTTTNRSREMESLVEQGVDSMDNMVESMQLINESTENIGGILADIRGIAKQTNLLSLNAAIEAAKAGDHGKGFAVVAQHVRELAERSTNATVNIQKMITESAARVSDGNVAVEEVQSILNEVSKLVHASTESVIQITNAAKEQSDMVSETFNEITLLRELSGITGESTIQIQEVVQIQDLAVKGLKEYAEALVGSVSQFKIEE